MKRKQSAVGHDRTDYFNLARTFFADGVSPFSGLLHVHHVHDVSSFPSVRHAIRFTPVKHIATPYFSPFTPVKTPYLGLDMGD